MVISARVDPEPEREMGTPRPIQLQLLRIRPLSGVAIDFRQGHHDRGLGRQGESGEFDLLGRHPCDAQVGDREVAQQFLDRGVDTVEVVAQVLQLFRMGQQRECAECEHVRGGLVPGDQ
jgi:hypothetical protein